MKRIYLVLGGVAAIGVAAAVYTTSSTIFSGAATEPVDLSETPEEELMELAHGAELGNPDAPVSVVEFGDYQCPGCAMFAASVKPLIELNLIETGRAKFVFYDLPLVNIHSNSFLASRASHCAGDQDRYWEYHTALFENQFSWASSATPISNFVGYARALSLDEDAFRGCLESDRHARRVSANLHLAERLNITGTPSVMVGGTGAPRRLPGTDFATIEDAVERLTEGEP